MDYKKISKNVGGDVGRNPAEKPGFAGKRKFLTTVAGAGAIVALLGAGPLAAQEAPKFKSISPWGEAPAQTEGKQREEVKPAWQGGEAKVAEEKKPVQIVNGINTETGRKIIPQSTVERLVKNAENGGYVTLLDDRYGGAEGTPTKAFEYFTYADKENEEVKVAFKAKEGGFEDSVLFKKATEKTIQIASFNPEGNEAFEDIVVAAGNGKLAVCLRAKNGVSSIVQASTAMKKGGINMFEDGVEQPVEAVIGYENKDGNITVISVPKNPQQGDSVLMVTISKEGIVSSEVREFKKRVPIPLPSAA